MYLYLTIYNWKNLFHVSTFQFSLYQNYPDLYYFFQKEKKKKLENGKKTNWNKI